MHLIMLNLTVNLVPVSLQPMATADDTASIHQYCEGAWGILYYREIKTRKFNLKYFYIDARVESLVTVMHDAPLAELQITGSAPPPGAPIIDESLLDMEEGLYKAGLEDQEYYPFDPPLFPPIQYSLGYSSIWSMFAAAGERRVFISLELSPVYLRELTFQFFKLAVFYGNVIHRARCLFTPPSDKAPLNSLLTLLNNFYLDIDDYQEDIRQIHTDNTCDFICWQVFTQLFCCNGLLFNDDMDLQMKTREAAILLTGDLREAMTIKSLERKIGVNIKKLRGGFKIFYGTNTQGYLNEKRMEKAVKLLLETAMPLSDIAIEIGYEEQDSLIKLFRRKIGCTPSFLRN